METIKNTVQKMIFRVDPTILEKLTTSAERITYMVLSFIDSGLKAFFITWGFAQLVGLVP